MKSILELLANHRIPGIQLSEKRRACADTIKALMGVPVSPSKLKFHEGVLSLSVPPVLKSAIFLKQEELKGLLLAQGITLTEIR